MSYELKLSNSPKENRRTAGIKWSPEMLVIITEKFAITFNKDLAKELGVGWRTLVRKARELNLEKETNFLDNNRDKISQLATSAKPANPMKGVKGWTVPGGEKHQFQKGNIPVTKTNPEVVEKIRVKRNNTIKRERARLKIGLPPLTKLKIRK